ncbi:MAG: hypothetical protein M1828_003675 [Chrysothrix sp. TS-e1954]|nr:MAG: hypothetical protein M1828_003675 [Chrysothrix sp. TS-e1954]
MAGFSGEGEEDDVEFHRINARVKQALATIYDPRSSNVHRNEATLYLDQQKTEADSPYRGVYLTSQTENSPVVRHYGLLLLEHLIKHKLGDCDTEQTTKLCSWIVQLAQNTTEQDAAFLRNKIAQLWAELAEQTWLTTWPDMDRSLLQLWQSSTVHQALVLHILETMSDEIFSTEDKTKDIREPALARACVEIVTSTDILVEESKQAQELAHLKSGSEGWYERLLAQLQSLISTSGSEQQDMIVKILSVLRSLLSWVTRAAIARSAGLPLFFECLKAPDVRIQMASVEVLHVIYHRRNLSSTLVSSLVSPAMSTQQISAFKSVRSSAEVDLEDLDETRYMFLKKFSEVMCGLGTIFLEHPSEIISTADVPAYVAFTLEILQDSSLVVSIPVLYLWTQLLASHQTLDHLLRPHISILLEICSRRTIRYEALPAQYEDDTIRFLNEDFEILPEKHAFVGNYRRFCSDIVERIVRQNPSDAMKHIIGQADGILQSVPEFERSLDRDRYESQSLYYSQIEAQAAVVTTAGKGYASWLKEQRADTGRVDQVHDQLLQDLESWCYKLLQMDIKDPNVLRRLLQLVLDITLAAFPTQSRFPLTICEKVLAYDLPEDSQSASYHEAIQELKYVSCRIVRKLAQKSTDVFMSVFPEFQQKINEVISRPNLDSRTKEDYKAVLFTIILRASTLNDQERDSRLHEMLEPTVAKWQDPQLTSAVSSFESFCKLLGLDQAAQYLFDNKAHSVQDWSDTTLDQHGQRVRDDLYEKPIKLPLVDTRALIGASSDKPLVGSAAYTCAKKQWRSAIPIILPNLLQLLAHVHAFSNPERFSSFPTEIQDIIQRSLVDRIWQSGISTESRDDFYIKVKGSKNTFEGLASAMRACIRTVRELCYWILHCMAPFEDAFYGHRDLPDALARALYEDAHVLSSHQFSILLKLSTALQECCPAESASYFLPPLLSGLFTQIDRKITAEWARLDSQATSANADEDALSQEMKSESIVRQLTNSAVNLIATLTKATDPQNASTLSPSHPAARRTALSNPQILEPLLLFLTHVLRVRDHRSCANAVKILLNQFLPEFKQSTAPAPNQNQTTSPHLDTSHATTASTSKNLGIDPHLSAQIRHFFSSDILKAAITSLHDGAFSDTHRDLASLIAGIIHTCVPPSSSSSSTNFNQHQDQDQDQVRTLLLSLPNMFPEKLDPALASIRSEMSERRQGRHVMQLLEGLRGVSIYEMGKLEQPGSAASRRVFGGKGGERSGVAARYTAAKDGGGGGGGGAGGMGMGMEVDEAGGGGGRVERGGSPVEGSIGQLFG